MKTFKVLEKPSGIMGISFEDLGLLSSVSLAVFFLINLLNIWVSVPGWIFLVAILLVFGLFIFIKRSNKDKKPQYLLSRVAWLRTPRRIFYHSSIFSNDQRIVQ